MLKSLILLLGLCLAFASDRNPWHVHDPAQRLPVKPLSEDVLKYRYGYPEDNTPVQFHLAFAGATGMMIAWQTDTDTPTHVCKYGTSPTSLTSSASGFSRTYGAGYTSFVQLNSLAASTKYYYSCGDATYGFSSTMSFTTAPASGSRTGFSFAVIGDMGIQHSAGTTNSVISHLSELNFTLHIGDLGYPDDAYLYGGTYEQTYTTFMNNIFPISSTQAYMGLPGNHETTCNEATPFVCPTNERNYTAYRTRWEFNNAASGGTQNMWYSFDYGMAHFIQVDTETDFPGSPEGPGTYLGGGPFGNQLAWIESDLQKANANRAKVPWIIMNGHRPVWYSAGQDASVNQFLLPLLTQYKVDIYLSGHEHNYERYYPINNQGSIAQSNYNNPQVPIYFVNGAGGNVEGHQKCSGNPNYIAFRNDTDFGWAKFTFMNVTTLHWQFFDGGTNTQIDECYITKPYS